MVGTSNLGSWNGQWTKQQPGNSLSTENISGNWNGNWSDNFWNLDWKIVHLVQLAARWKLEWNVRDYANYEKSTWKLMDRKKRGNSWRKKHGKFITIVFKHLKAETNELLESNSGSTGNRVYQPQKIEGFILSLEPVLRGGVSVS